jgi:heme ABC exporter ATP-binding subunit CcmA
VTAVLEARNLHRVFGRQRAVDGVSFTLRDGEALAVFGPNGAGKTTLLRLLAGLLRPSAGEALVSDMRVAGSAAARARIGIISHESMLYHALTARENVELAARLYGVPDPQAAAVRALEQLRIAHTSSPVRALSRGQRQRVSIARALVHEPSVLLLDEPFTGLDDAGAAALGDVLRTVRGSGAALVLVTHNIAEGLSLGTRAAVMHRGKFVRVTDTSGAEPGAFAFAYREMVTA